MWLAHGDHVLPTDETKSNNASLDFETETGAVVECSGVTLLHP